MQTLLARLEEVPAECWQALARSRILFGHQSVGADILRGMQELLDRHPHIGLRIWEARTPADAGGPGLAHFRVGRNTDPHSKIRAFGEWMAALRDHVDIACFKVCYVDLTPGVDAEALFERYRQAHAELERACPGTAFLHLSAPICGRPPGLLPVLKACARVLLRRPGVVDGNLVRDRYSELLKTAYSAQGTCFDLALVESVGRDGLCRHATRAGRRVPLMAPENTSDGGHLSAHGRQQVALQLLVRLAQAARAPS
ncbi:MAG: hypothetical protein AB1505_25840 [Candidatus Latescibacterota bacterium]